MNGMAHPENGKMDIMCRGEEFSVYTHESDLIVGRIRVGVLPKNAWNGTKHREPTIEEVEKEIEKYRGDERYPQNYMNILNEVLQQLLYQGEW
jgi:hypothetical protein